MIRLVPAPGVALLPKSVMERLRKEGDEAWTSRYLYRVVRYRVELRFVQYDETVVVRYPLKHSDTSAALVVALVIDE